ncbi:MAG: DUF4381 family protein [Chitinophagaceae bacterium]
MNKKIFRTLVFIIPAFLSVAVTAFAQQITVAAKTDAQQIVVGDQLRYFITVQTQKGNAVIWPKIADTFNSLEIVEKSKIDTGTDGNNVTYKQRLLITGFDSGSFAIPRLIFSVKGTTDTFFTDSFRIAVNTVPVDTTKPFKEIKGLEEVQTSWRDYIWMIVGILITVIIIVLVTLYFARRKKPAKPVIPAKTETFSERALRLLAELDARQLWQQDKPKEYYTELSDIVRQYIEARFQTNAMELTTDELLQKARKHREMTSFIKSLKPLLHAADMAKFAKAHPLPEEHIEALELARNFVRVSAPKEPKPQNPATEK